MAEDIWQLMAELEMTRKRLYRIEYEHRQLELDPESSIHSPELYAVWNLKIHLVRRVVDLNPLSDTERVELISGCKDKVCVSYTIRPSAAVALAAAAVLIPLSVAAQDVAVEEEYMIVGAIVEPTDVEYYAHADAVALAEMPVIYDDEPTTPALDEVTSIPTNQTANPQRSNE